MSNEPLEVRASEDTIKIIAAWASKNEEHGLATLLIVAAQIIANSTPPEALNTRLILEAAAFKQHALSVAEKNKEKAKKKAAA